MVCCDAGRNVAVEFKSAKPPFVTDGFMVEAIDLQAVVALSFICIDGQAFDVILSDELQDGLFLHVLEDEEKRPFSEFFLDCEKCLFICSSDVSRVKASPESSQSSST